MQENQVRTIEQEKQAQLLYATVEKAKAGDPDAVTELIRMTYQDMYHRALMVTGNDADAKDAVQEASISIIRSLPSQQGSENYLGWMHTIVTHMAVNAATKASRTHEVPFVNLQHPTEEDDDLDYDPKDETIRANPEMQYDQQAKREIIMKIMNGLSEEQRIVTYLYFYDNKTMNEIAQELHVPTTTVVGRLNTAKKYIKSSVTAMQSKDGIKLYNLAPLPFFLYLLASYRKGLHIPYETAAPAAAGIGSAAQQITASAAGSSAAASHPTAVRQAVPAAGSQPVTAAQASGSGSSAASAGSQASSAAGNQAASAAGTQAASAAESQAASAAGGRVIASAQAAAAASAPAAASTVTAAAGAATTAVAAKAGMSIGVKIAIALAVTAGGGYGTMIVYQGVTGRFSGTYIGTSDGVTETLKIKNDGTCTFTESYGLGIGCTYSLNDDKTYDITIDAILMKVEGTMTVSSDKNTISIKFDSDAFSGIDAMTYHKK